MIAGGQSKLRNRPSLSTTSEHLSQEHYDPSERILGMVNHGFPSSVAVAT